MVRNLINSVLVVSIVLSGNLGFTQQSAYPARSAQVAPSAQSVTTVYETQSREYQLRFDEYNKFLLRSGFDDISKEISATLEEAKAQGKPAGIGLDSQEQLEFSKERYELINLARQFSSALMAMVAPKLSDEETKDKIIDLATKFISLRPIPDPIQDSSQIPANLNTPGEIAKVTLDHKINAIKNQAERFISDIGNLLYGRQEIERILSGPDGMEKKALETSLRRGSEYMVQYLARINSDIEMGQSRELGSALALLLVLHARLNGDRGLEKSLRQNFYAVGEPLEKHIVINEEGDKISDGEVTAKILMMDENGKEVPMTIKNGDILGEMSDGSVAAQIAAAVRPHPRNFFYALRNGMWGYMLNVWINNIRTNNGKLNSFLDRIKEILKAMPFATRGISHGGQAWVITSKVTNKLRLGKVRVTDMYNNNHGGIRYTDLQFAIPGVHKRFIISSYDPKKYAEFALQQIEEIERTGVIPPAWITKGEKRDKDGDVVADKSKRIEVPANITIDELSDWKRQIQESPEKWFYSTLMPRIQKDWRQALVKDGMSFAHNLKDTIGSAACFKQMILSWKRATGLEPRLHEDRIAIPVKVLAAFNAKAVEGVDMETIAAPATLNWQAGLVSKSQKVTFKNSNEAAIQLNLRSVGLNERDPELTYFLRKTDLINQMVKGLDEAAVLHAFVENLNYHDKARSKSRFDPFHKDTKKQEVNLEDLNNQIGRVSERQLLVSGGSNPEWIRNLSKAQLQKFLDSMLRDLGYEDYVTPTEETLKEIEIKKSRGEEVPHAINIQTLKDNAFRYKTVNSTRNLTKLVMEKIYRRLDDPAVRGNLTVLIAKLLATKPTAPPPELPDIIKNLPARNEREKDFKVEKAEEFLFEYAKENIYDHTRHITADLVRLVYSPEETKQYRAEILSGRPGKKALEYKEFVDRAYNDTFVYVRQMYLDPQTGQTRWLGRQMYQSALWYARRFEHRTESELETALYKEIKSYNLDPENFAGDSILLHDRDGKSKLVKVNTGDAWTSLSKGTEAVGIKHGASTKRKLMLQVIFDAYSQVGDNNIENGQNLGEKFLHAIAELGHHNTGISHVGGILGYSTKDKLVSNRLLEDNYPYENDESFGGFRIFALEKAMNGAHNKGFGVTSYDIKKIFDIFKTLEYREEIWEAFEPKIEVNEDGSMEILPQAKPKPHNWRTRLAKEKFLEMQKGTLEQFEPWFHNQLKHGAKVFITEMGVFFNWVNTGAGKAPGGKEVSGNDWYGGVYCSATLHIKFSMFTQMRLAFGKSDWSYFTKLLHKFGVPGIKEMAVEGKILTPDEVREAPFVKESFNVLYDPRTIGEMEAEEYAKVPYLAEDRQLSEDLKAIVPRVEIEIRPGEYHNLVHAYSHYIAATLSDKGLKLYSYGKSFGRTLLDRINFLGQKLMMRKTEKPRYKVNPENLAIFKSHHKGNVCEGLF